MSQTDAIHVTQEKKEKLYKRTLIIVMLSQVFGGAGLAAGITVGALLAGDMMGDESVTGLPAALFTLGSAAAALIVGRMSNRFGRRLGLSLGFITGGMGAALVVLAAVIHNIPLLFIAMFIYGSGTATNLQARYAGTDLATKKQRGTAVSIAMFATTFGAVAGPNLVGVMGDFAESLGVPALAGPFILSAVAFTLAGIVLLILMRPDPLFVALAYNEKNVATNDDISERTETNHRLVITGAIIMVMTQIVMLAIMTMTPIHMGHHGHPLESVGLVIGFHIAAMYMPSPITGILVDKIGRKMMAMMGGVTLLGAGVVAFLAPGESLFWITIALILLGLGWNFGLISGTALIVDATEPTTRAKLQGTVDVFIALGGASGSAMSGMVVAGASFELLSLAGGVFSLLLIPIVLRGTKQMRQN
ncbi:MFS transporter [Aliicoccus persicus]|uniref:Sugar phosphate permease n=1 Tax=Aliicoccus persicus TaxID=930138 RepID=A0A662Z5E2_9STAP|nr:MFS transporter [Aliicoccus persicus]SEW18254.1 Sugar phosphate permease [Aliicoccus persicus]